VDHPAPLARLIDELRRLPGIGPKSAQRIAFHLLKGSKEDALRLSAAVGELLEALFIASREYARQGARLREAEVPVHSSSPVSMGPSLIAESMDKTILKPHSAPNASPIAFAAHRG